MAKPKRHKKYVQGEVTIPFKSRHKLPHVAQEYEEAGKPDIAFELARNLRRQSRIAVIGTGITPGEAFSL